MVALILVFVLKDSQASYTVRKRQMKETQSGKTERQIHRGIERQRDTETQRDPGRGRAAENMEPSL